MGNCCDSTALVESFLMCRFKRHVAIVFSWLYSWFFFPCSWKSVICVFAVCDFFLFFLCLNTIWHACKHCDHVAISHSQPVCQGFVSTQEDQRYLWSLWLDSDWDRQESDWVIGVTDSQSWPSDTHKIGTQVKQLAALVRNTQAEIKIKAQTRSNKHVTLINTIQIRLVGFSNICASPQYVQ